MNKNVSILISIVLIILVTSVSRAESVDPPKDAVVRVGLSYGNPVLPESLTAISLYIRTSDKTFLEQTIEQFEWWKYINVQFQTVGLDSLSEGGALSDVRDAKKYWQFTKPVLSNPLENSENDIKEVRGGYHIEKTFILDIPLYQKPAGTVFILFGSLDTRDVAKENEEIPSLYIPSVGASPFTVQDESVLQNPHHEQNFTSHQFRAELLRGNFEKAKEWIQKYLEAEGDPVIAAEFQMKIFLYQHEFQKALEQYKKMAIMDAIYRKEHPDVEAYVLPQMVDEFEKKINAAIEREKAKSDTEEVQ